MTQLPRHLTFRQRVVTLRARRLHHWRDQHRYRRRLHRNHRRSHLRVGVHPLMSWRIPTDAICGLVYGPLDSLRIAAGAICGFENVFIISGRSADGGS